MIARCTFYQQIALAITMIALSIASGAVIIMALSTYIEFFDGRSLMSKRLGFMNEHHEQQDWPGHACEHSCHVRPGKRRCRPPNDVSAVASWRFKFQGREGIHDEAHLHAICFRFCWGIWPSARKKGGSTTINFALTHLGLGLESVEVYRPSP